jgi:hypothetical protein
MKIKKLSCQAVFLLSMAAMQYWPAYGHDWESYGQEEDPLIRQLHFERKMQQDRINAENMEITRENLAEAAKEKADFNVKIADARSQFWAAYPDQPSLPEAQTNFEALLQEKDLHFLMLALYYQNNRSTVDNFNVGSAKDGEEHAAGVNALVAMIDNGNGGKLDGGIPSECQYEFNDWAEAVEAKLKDSDQHEWDSLNALGNYLLTRQALVTKALGDSQAKYKIYVESRNWAEFQAAGREPVNAADPFYYTVMLLAHFERMPWNEAESDFSTMIGLMGSNALKQAAIKIHSAPKDKNGHISDPHSLALWPYQYSSPAYQGGMDRTTTVPPGFFPLRDDDSLSALMSLLSRDPAKNFLLEMLARSNPNPGQTALDRGQTQKNWDWDYAANTYERWSIAFGEEAVLKVAEQLRTATKRQFDGNVANPRSIGAIRSTLYTAFQDILMHDNPQGYVRAILAFNWQLTTTAATDEKYQELVSKYGEKTVLDAAKKMAGRYKSRAADWPSPELPSDLQMLVGVLNGSIKIETTAKVEDTSDLMPNPEYAVWTNLPIGTVVTHASKSWVERNGKIYPGTSGGEIFFENLKLLSFDQDGVTLLFSENQYHPPGSYWGDHYMNVGAFSGTREPVTENCSAHLYGNSSDHGEGIPVTLDILGKTMQCTMLKYTNRNGVVCSWTSTEVPGGLAQKISVESTRATTTAPVDLLVNATTLVLPPVEDLGAMTTLPTMVFPKSFTPLSAGESADSQAVPADAATQPASGTSTRSSGQGTIPAGTVLYVRLTDPIPSDNIDTGGKFRAQILRPVGSAGQTLIPLYTEVSLKATRQNVKNLATVNIFIDHLVLNGKSISVQAQPFAVNIPMFHSGSATGFGLTLNNQKINVNLPGFSNHNPTTGPQLVSPGRELIFHLVQPLVLP